MQEAETQSRSDSNADATDRRLNVLLVEDNDVDVLNIRRAFKRAKLDHNLLVVNSAERAFSILRDEDDEMTLPRHRRLILLDLNLPQISGFDFLRNLRSDPQLVTTPVVVLTSSDIDRDKVEAYRFNVAGYLIKPVGQDEFSKLVKALDGYWTSSEFPPQAS
jgi:CheY-like chemotaxis protein